MIYALILVTIISAVFIWFHLQGLDIISEKKAIKELEEKLFIKGVNYRQEVIKSIHDITNNRLTDEEALDYFLKIKGLQVINLNAPINYWTRKYLMSSTKAKLNYFEQVRFYEAFLNYVDSSKKEKTSKGDIKISSFQLTQAAEDLIKKRATSNILE